MLTKVLQRGRLAAYLEQSTRYIPYDAPMEAGAEQGAPGSWRYWRDDDLGPEFGRAMDEIFTIYSATLERGAGLGRASAGPAARSPRAPGERSIKAKALDLLRGLLPASTLSHVGIYASGQAYEQLLLRLASSPLPEAREVGAMALSELGAVIPSFHLPRRPPRARRRVDLLPRASPRRHRALGRAARPRPPRGPRRPLGGADPRRRRRGRCCSPPRCTRRPACPRRRSQAGSRTLDPIEREELLAELVGERGNRRHRPGRGWEAVRYRFEIVSDYGGFRDMQRHRMLTCQWQSLGPDLGAGVPEEVVEAGAGDDYRRALEISRTEFERLEAAGHAPRPRPTPSASATGSATSST